MENDMDWSSLFLQCASCGDGSASFCCSEKSSGKNSFWKGRNGLMKIRNKMAIALRIGKKKSCLSSVIYFGLV